MGDIKKEKQKMTLPPVKDEALVVFKECQRSFEQADKLRWDFYERRRLTREVGEPLTMVGILAHLNIEEELQKMTPKQFANHLLRIDEEILRDNITFKAVIRGYCLREISDPQWAEVATILISDCRDRVMLWAEETQERHQRQDNHIVVV